MLTACQIAPDLNAPPSSQTSLKANGKVAGGMPVQCIKDFWGNCKPLPDEPNQPAAKSPAKAAKAPAGPCEKDFWGNCKQPSPSALPSNILAPSIFAAPANPPAKGPETAAGPCEKDFWGNCIPATTAPPSQPKTAAKVADGGDGKCVRDFWGNCTPVASNRHPYRWRYVRPGHRDQQSPPTASAGGGGSSGGRVEYTGPSVVCHPKRRVIGEEQATTEQAQFSAEQAWMGAVRYDFGERYQNLALAKEVRYTCAPSSSATSPKGKMFRCTTEAMPCRASGGN